jgi:hypothetical protein
MSVVLWCISAGGSGITCTIAPAGAHNDASCSGDTSRLTTVCAFRQISPSSADFNATGPPTPNSHLPSPVLATWMLFSSSV